MRILFVTPYVPSRIRVRPFHLIRSLAASHTILLASLVCEKYEMALALEMSEYCAALDLVKLPRWRSYTNCLRALPSTLPLRVAYYQSPQFVEHILRIIRECEIDIVHGELIKVVPSLRAVLARERIPVVYDSVDCISSYLEQRLQAERNPLRKAFIASELRKMLPYESEALHDFDQVIVTSEHDRDCLAKEYSLHFGVLAPSIEVVPNGVDTDYFVPPLTPRNTDTLVFCAKMDYEPNAQAMLHFCRAILPAIWVQRPYVRLVIVGNNPPPAIRDLAADKRITVTGYVPDIRPYLGQAAVALAPLLVAAGVQNKVLEALAMSTPLVATPLACRALNVQDGEHLLIAEHPLAFANAVLRLLDDPLFAAQMSSRGREYVEQRHSWHASARLLDDLYQKIIDEQRHETLLASTSLV